MLKASPENKSQMKKLAIIHPLLFAAYAVLAVLVRNLGDVPSSAIERSLIVSVSGAAILILILYSILKDWTRARLITSFMIILFFSYGHLYSVANSWELTGIVLGRHSLMLPLWVTLLGLWIWWVTRKIQNLQPIVSFFSIFSLILVFFPIYTLVGYQIRSSRTSPDRNIIDLSGLAIESQIGEILPDIYYIILDGYGRQDILEQLYDYDNSAFINELIADGFYVAGESRTNYIKTLWSLSSSLNMSYLDEFTEIVGKDSKDKAPLEAFLRENQVQNSIQRSGVSNYRLRIGIRPGDADGCGYPIFSFGGYAAILVP